MSPFAGSQMNNRNRLFAVPCASMVTSAAWRINAAVFIGAICATAMAEESADELAKKLSNPVASLISVPFQYNIDFDIGSENGTKQDAQHPAGHPRTPSMTTGTSSHA